MSQPANGTIRAPSRACSSYRGVRRSVCIRLDARRAVVLVAEEGGDLDLFRGFRRFAPLAHERGLLALGHGAPAARSRGAKPGRNHGHPYLVLGRIVDDRAEDDVGFLVRSA